MNPKYDLDGEYDPSQSEDEYSDDEKRLLKNLRDRNKDDDDSEEEVYGFSESESDKNDLADSDVEGKGDSEDDLPNLKAWGKQKRSFYSTDYVDQDYGGFGKDEQAATQEEQEARLLQTRLAEQLNDEDFSLDFFTSKKSDAKIETQTVIQTDLSQMSKRQKLQWFEKESPEFSGLVEDFKIKMSLATEKLELVLKLAKDSQTENCPAAKFVKTMYDLILNYCTNISFYLLLKAKKVNIQNHPVIKRLYQYRQMLNQLEPVYESSIKHQVEDIILAWESRQDNILVCNKETVKTSKKHTKTEGTKLKLLSSFDRKNKNSTEDKGSNSSAESEELENNVEDSADEYIEESLVAQNDVSFSEVPDGEKRAITYQMAKNKGLTPKRKKEQRNPRVKHRNKFRIAKIRRKGAIREVRKEVNRYAGEISGIKTNVKKSIKIK